MPAEVGVPRRQLTQVATPAADGREMRGRSCVAWCLAALVVLVVSLGTTIGPVVVGLGGPHGVHVGDLVVLAVAVGCAAVAPAPEKRTVRVATG